MKEYKSINNNLKDDSPTITRTEFAFFEKDGVPASEEYSYFVLNVGNFLRDTITNNLYQITSFQVDPNDQFHYTNMTYNQIITSIYTPT